MASVYIIQSEKNGRYYVGCTNNLKRRFYEHNKGSVRSTKPYRPWTLRLSQEYIDLSKARKIERRIKELNRRDYIERIVADGVIKMEL